MKEETIPTMDDIFKKYEEDKLYMLPYMFYQDVKDFAAEYSQITSAPLLKRIEDLKQSIRDGIPAAVGLMENISDSKDKTIFQLQKRISELEGEIKALHNQDQ